MDVPASFKFDVRVRARLLAKGVVSEEEVTKHLESLADVQEKSDTIELTQPALTNPEDRERIPVPRVSAFVTRPIAPAPASVRGPVSVPPLPSAVDEGWGEDDDDLDDEDDEDEDDEDEDEKPAEAKPAEAKPAEAKPVDEDKPAEAKPAEAKPVDEDKPDAKSPADVGEPSEGGGEEE